MIRTLYTTFALGTLLVSPTQAVEPAGTRAKAELKAIESARAVGENHKLLASLAGEWTTKIKVWLEPGQAPLESTGKVVNVMILEGRQLQTTHTGTFADKPYEGLGTTGYDNVTQKFVSSWRDNTRTGDMNFTGTYDPATKTFALKGEAASMRDPKVTVKLRTATRIVDADTYVLELYGSYGGREERLTEVTYTRRK